VASLSLVLLSRGVRQLATLREMKRFRRLWLDAFGVWQTADPGTAVRWTLAVVWHLPTIIRTRTLKVADAALADREGRYRLKDVRISLPGQYFGLAREIYCRRVYSWDHRFGIERNDIVVDLGCNVGVFAVWAASAGKRVLAVEAQAALVDEARSTLKMNECADHARVVHALVGADTGFFDTERQQLADPLIGNPPRMSMSDLLAEVPLIDLLKIDIEGSEFALFSEEPGLPWLDRVRRIVMEVHPEFGRAANLSSTLAERGFSSQFVTNHGAPTEDLDDIGYLFAWR
jgi:FkbM family methyltransferase